MKIRFCKLTQLTFLGFAEPLTVLACPSAFCLCTNWLTVFVSVYFLPQSFAICFFFGSTVQCVVIVVSERLIYFIAPHNYFCLLEINKKTHCKEPLRFFSDSAHITVDQARKFMTLTDAANYFILFHKIKRDLLIKQTHNKQTNKRTDKLRFYPFTLSWTLWTISFVFLSHLQIMSHWVISLKWNQKKKLENYKTY